MKKMNTLLCSLALTLPLLANAGTSALDAAVKHKDRPAAQAARDNARHPAETLGFFGIKPDMSVVEISPGGGWYTNILAPLLKDKGQFYAAHFYIEENTRDYFKKSRAKFEQKVKDHGPYNNIKVTSFDPIKSMDIAPPGSTDMVLTFRNIHNWYMRHDDTGVQNAFQAFYIALKPGGVLGVVEHRLPENLSDEEMKKSGYMKQSYVIKMAEKAGFKLAAKSEVNANAKDTAQHPKGVWTLPPRLRLGEQDKAKYMAIGESDRMTLKFVKPK